MNLWLMTEEKPKHSVIKDIINLYAREKQIEEINTTVSIVPKKEKGKFNGIYEVINANVHGINGIYIMIVSGSSSFVDYLVFESEDSPIEGQNVEPLFAIEETKTSDKESRNTGVYQRGSKFAYIKKFFPTCKLVMLYNGDLDSDDEKKPSDTSIFGTNLLLTLGVQIIGKDVQKWFSPFENIDTLIAFKAEMRKPPAGNTPIDIEKNVEDNVITISGMLSKPSTKGNIGHDPNIGALSLIAACIRKLNWEGKIVITRHNVTQVFIDNLKSSNKFLEIAKIYNIELDGISIPDNIPIKDKYWYYEKKSEKIASIFLHIFGELNGYMEVYQNHAGCERGYFKTKNGENIQLPKKDSFGQILYIPDLILYSSTTEKIFLIEGKQLSTLKQGLEELNNYDSIENEFIRVHYPDAEIIRCLTINGGFMNRLPNEKVLLYINDNGGVIFNSTFEF